MAPCDESLDCEHANDVELTRLEEELRAPVPDLLEAVVNHQVAGNHFQLELEEAHSRYRRRLGQTGRLYEALRARHGWEMDRATLRLDAERALALASEKVQAALRDFTEAPARREAAEVAYAAALQGHADALQAAKGARERLSDAALAQGQACLRRLEAHREQVAVEQRCIAVLEGKVQQSKIAHKHAMDKLEFISKSIHVARAEHCKEGADRAQEEAEAEDQPDGPPGLPSTGAHRLRRKGSPSPLLRATTVRRSRLRGARAQCCASATSAGPNPS